MLLPSFSHIKCPLKLSRILFSSPSGALIRRLFLVPIIDLQKKFFGTEKVLNIIAFKSPPFAFCFPNKFNSITNALAKAQSNLWAILLNYVCQMNWKWEFWTDPKMAMGHFNEFSEVVEAQLLKYSYRLLAHFHLVFSLNNKLILVPSHFRPLEADEM